MQLTCRFDIEAYFYCFAIIKNGVTNMASHRVFFSFEYNKDYWRAVQIRNLGKASADSVFPDQAWEKVRVNTNEAIKQWINEHPV